MRIRITDKKSEFFTSCWELYEAAFPEEERRDLDYQLEILHDNRYHFEAVMEQGEAVGLIGWWEFEELRYIEHLAIFDRFRNRGLGKTILEEFHSERQPGLIILEVEPPCDELSSRRIGFYERLGYYLNRFEYFQPSYRGGDPLELLIMSYPRAISREELTKFNYECLSVVHPHVQI